MTLVLHIPCEYGILMIADRQNTFTEDLTKEPVDKIVLLENFTAIVGYTGPTQKCRFLTDSLRTLTPTNPFIEEYLQLYDQLYKKPMLGFSSQDTELLVVSKTSNNTFETYRILGSTPNRVDSGKCIAIGVGTKYITPQLELDTRAISFEKAEEFGVCLLEYTSRIDASIGSPISYGYTRASITKSKMCLDIIKPKEVDLSKLLYRFES